MLVTLRGSKGWKKHKIFDILTHFFSFLFFFSESSSELLFCRKWFLNFFNTPLVYHPRASKNIKNPKKIRAFDLQCFGVSFIWYGVFLECCPQEFRSFKTGKSFQNVSPVARLGLISVRKSLYHCNPINLIRACEFIIELFLQCTCLILSCLSDNIYVDES